MKSRTNRVLLSAFLVLSMIVSLAGVFNSKVYATNLQDNNQIHMSTKCSSGYSNVSLSFSKNFYQKNENLVVNCTAEGESAVISSYTYVKSDLDVLSEVLYDNGIMFVFTVEENSYICSFQISTVLTTGKECVNCAYILNSPYGIFTSTVSETYLLRQYYYYLKETEKMDSDAADAAINELYSSGVDISQSELENSIDATYIEGDASVMATADTHISVTFNWFGSNNVSHPLIGTKVEMYDKTTLGEKKLDTKYTNSSGIVRFSFENADDFLDFDNGGYDIFFKVYSQDSGNVRLTDISGNIYGYSTYTNNPNSTQNNKKFFCENIQTGSNLSVNINIMMDNELGQAFQVLQSALYARNYAEVMMEETPDPVTIIYPYESNTNKYSYYDLDTKTIYIWNEETTRYMEPYESWDTIMHEYGHHIQLQLEICEFVGGFHSFDQNLIDERGKQNGIYLAWSESWATVFSLMAQSYYSSYFSGIPEAGDTAYRDFDYENRIEIDNCDFEEVFEDEAVVLGEGSELAISAVLWDLFDSGTELHDNISLGHADYWYITTNGKPLTFDEFAGDFFDEYYTSTNPTMILDWGDNLTEFQFAPRALRSYCYGGTSASDPVTIRWYAQGGSLVAPNNEFALAFYDQYYDEIYFITDITGESYTLDAYDWEYILDSCGSKYYVSVVGYQTSTPSTGWYFSRPISFDAP